MRNTKFTIICLGCGASFHPWYGREKTSKFCGGTCNGRNLSKALRTTEVDFWSRTAPVESGCVEWTGARSNGYGSLTVGGRRVFAHRHSFELTKGEIPTGVFVCHSCDNRLCVKPDHLWLGTHTENMADMIAKGRNYRGPSKVHSERHPKAKLTCEKVALIRQDTRPAPAVAKDYNVSPSLIRGIRRGENWKYA